MRQTGPARWSPRLHLTDASTRISGPRIGGKDSALTRSDDDEGRREVVWAESPDRRDQPRSDPGQDTPPAELEVSFLEDRRLLTAVMPVTSTADSGPGTLREVIGEANAATQPVEIRFDLKGGGCDALTSGPSSSSATRPSRSTSSAPGRTDSTSTATGPRGCSRSTRASRRPSGGRLRPASPDPEHRPATAGPASSIRGTCPARRRHCRPQHDSRLPQRVRRRP